MNIRSVPWTTFLIFLLLCGCGGSGESPTGGVGTVTDGTRVVSQGIERTQPVPAAETAVVDPATLASKSVTAATDQPPLVAGRVIPRPHRPIPSAVADATHSSPTLPSAGMLDRYLDPSPSSPSPSPLAPSAISAFVGLVDTNTAIPPDTMGAVGPNHLVSFLNTEVGFFEKWGPQPPVGTRLNPGTSLRDFWLPLISANHLPDSAFSPKVFDPKVIYDPGSRRFVAVTLDGRLPTDNSWVLLAVSQFSDPTLGWNTWAIPADNTGATWADYPGLGIDNNAVFVTANMFNAADPPVFQRGKVWRIPKGQLLLTPQATSLKWTEFTTPEFNLQPAHTFGTAPAEFFLTEGNIRIIGGRNFFVDLQVLAVTGSPPTLVSVGAVPITQYPFLANGLPVAPNDNVDTGDTRIQNVVYRNNHLYTTHTVSNSTASKTEVAWYEIAPSPTPTIVQQGRISDASRFYYYPSIAVNANGDIAIGFSGSSLGSSPADFPGAYYTARLSTDTLGFTQPVGILKAGEAAYFKTFGTATDPNRWGDYSATVVDPSDDLTFWTIQEYARPTAGTFPNTGRWGTWWGSFRMTTVAAPGNLTAIATGPFQVLLSWIRQSTNETGYRVERSPTGAVGSFAVITPSDLPAGTTSYTDTSVSVLPGNTYHYRVQSFNATDNAYSITASATTPPDIAPPYNLTATLLPGPVVILAWVDNATNTNTLNIVVERKAGASGTFSPISPLLPNNSTTYTDNSALAPGTLYTYRVGAVSSLSTAYSLEVSVTTPVVPPSSGGGGGGGGCLSTADFPSGGNPISQAISIGSLLLPIGAISSRKLLVQGWRKIRLRHPVC